MPKRVPLSIKTKLKEEFEKLVDKQVIAPVTEPTDWINSMIVVKKPNKLRICLDPKDLNKAIKRSNHPIPNIVKSLHFKLSNQIKSLHFGAIFAPFSSYIHLMSSK